MQTNLAPEYQNTADGQEAEAILRKCVHCGFCTATCPTYQLLGDELDGPRGRIYLIKQVLEGVAPTPRKALNDHERVLLSSAQDAELFLFSAPSIEILEQQVRRVAALAGRLSLSELTELRTPASVIRLALCGIAS